MDLEYGDDRLLDGPPAAITAAIPSADAELRASLLSAIVHGVINERYLLRLGRLAMSKRTARSW